jgi:integrase
MTIRSSPSVVAEADPAAGHVQAVGVEHEVHGALRPDGAVVGRVPAHEDLVVPQPQFSARRAFSDVGGKIVLGTPKSHLARTVPLPRFLAAALATSVQGKNPDDLVFTTVSGSVVRSANWRQKVFLAARKQAGISDRFRIHDLRHTAAALMIQAGYPPKMLQEILGHASITTTLHLYPGDMDKYADRLYDAATDAGKAKIRPEDEEDGPVES